MEKIIQEIKKHSTFYIFGHTDPDGDCVGSQLGLHPVVTLCSMFVGAQLLGAVGMFGFPILLSLLRYLNDHEVIHIFK